MLKKITLYFLLGIIGLIAQNVFAVPAVPGPVEKVQPDGTKITVYLKGDEQVHWMESQDGYTLMYDSEKYIVYAQQDSRGDMIPSNLKFGKNAPTGISKGLRYSKSQVDVSTQIRKMTSDAGTPQKASQIGTYQPIRNLQIKQVAKDVNLTWEAPYNGRQVTYATGTTIDNLPITAATCTEAIRFAPEDMEYWGNVDLTKLRFHSGNQQNTSNRTYTLKIWSGGNGSTPGNLDYSQTIGRVNNNAWVDVTLTTPYTVDIEKNLWIGLQVDLNNGNGKGIIPIARISGTVVTGKSNLLYLNNTWGVGADGYNWTLTATLEPNASAKKLTGYEISLNGNDRAKVSSTSLSYSDTGVQPGGHSYCVTAVYGGDDLSEAVCETIAVDPYYLVENLTITQGENKITLNWEAPSDGLNSAPRFIISRNGIDIGAVDADAGTYDDYPEESGDYTYCVTVEYDDGELSEPVCESSTFTLVRDLFSFSADRLSFAANGNTDETLTITISDPEDYITQLGLTCHVDAPDWITYEIEDDKITFSASANTSGEFREGSIRVWLGNEQDTFEAKSGYEIPVTQKSMLTLSMLEYNLDPVRYTGTEKPVEVSLHPDYNGLGDITVKYDGSADNPVKANTYVVSISALEDTNFDAVDNLVLGEFTILPADATIRPDNVSRPYGTDNPEFTFTVDGLQNTDTEEDIDDLEITTEATIDSLPGEYPITASGAVNSNYTFIYDPGILTITKLPQIITFPEIPSKLTGDSFDAGASVPSGLKLTYTSSDPDIAEVDSDGRITTKKAGTVSITASQDGDDIYLEATAVTREFAVRALLDLFSIPVEPLSFATDGSTDETIEITITDEDGCILRYGLTCLVNAPDWITYKIEDNKITFSASANTSGALRTGSIFVWFGQEGEDAETTGYLIGASQKSMLTPSMLDYDLTTVIYNGTAQPVSVSLKSEDADLVDITVKYDGSTDNPVNADTYVVSISVLEDTNFDAVDNLVLGNFSIRPAGLMIQPNDASRPYGEDNPEFTLNIIGLQGTDSQEDLGDITISTPASDSSLPGIYPITASGAQNPNYAYVYQSGKLTITKLPQAITFPEIIDRVVGDSFDADASASSDLDVTYTSSDPDIAEVTSNGTITAKAVGTVTITAEQSGNEIYSAATAITRQFTVSLVHDVFSLSVDQLRFAADGNTDETITATLFYPEDYITYLGFDWHVSVPSWITYTIANNEIIFKAIANTSGSLREGNIRIWLGKNSSTFDAETGYEIPVSQKSQLTASMLNYDLASVTYNGRTQSPNVSLHPDYSGLGAISVKYNGSADKPFNANTYVISISALEGTNFDAVSNLALGNFSILPTGLLIQPENASRLYGADNPEFTLNIIGLKGEDSQIDLGDITVTTTANTLSLPGTYPITASDAQNSNYAIIYQQGTLTINKLSQTITFPEIADQEIGDSFNAGATASSGLEITYTSSDPAIAEIDANGMVTAKAVGTVTITASQSGSNIYLAAAAITRQFTVTDKNLTGINNVEANNKVIVYPNPASRFTPIYVSADVDETLLSGAIITVYNAAGTLIKNVQVTGKLTEVKLTTAGTYFLTLKGKEGVIKSMKVIVK